MLAAASPSAATTTSTTATSATASFSAGATAFAPAAEAAGAGSTDPSGNRGRGVGPNRSQLHTADAERVLYPEPFVEVPEHRVLACAHVRAVPGKDSVPIEPAVGVGAASSGVWWRYPPKATSQKRV